MGLEATAWDCCTLVRPAAPLPQEVTAGGPTRAGRAVVSLQPVQPLGWGSSELRGAVAGRGGGGGSLPWLPGRREGEGQSGLQRDGGPWKGTSQV